MKITSALPTLKPSPKQSIDEKVSFEDEALQSRYLGSIPMNYWSPWMGFGGYRSAPGGVGWGQAIYRDCPIYEPDGKPRVEVRNPEIKANPYSVPLFGALGAAGGGAVGAGIGALIAHFSGLGAAVTGAVGVAGAVAGGAALAHYAAGDRVRLEWREFAINEKELEGYYESVTPHMETRCHTVSDGDNKSHQECYTVQNGWDHFFSPDVRYWPVGSFVGPQVVHYQQSSGEWKPDSAPKPDANEKPKEGVDPANPPKPNNPAPAVDPPPNNGAPSSDPAAGKPSS